MKRILFAFLVICLVILVGCSQSLSKSTASSKTATIAISPVSSTSTEILDTLTLTPTPTVEIFPSPTATLLPTVVPTLTSTVVPAQKYTFTDETKSFLMIRYPNINELSLYLTEFASEYFLYNAEEAESCLYSREQAPCGISSKYLFYEFSSGLGISLSEEEYLKSGEYFHIRNIERANILYKDVNGDSEDDLIITASDFVTVFIWEEGKYGYPFTILYYPRKYGEASQVFFEDWTKDDVPEVIFDYRHDTGGTDIFGHIWYRHIIHCSDVDCHLVWDNEINYVINHFNRNNGLGFAKSHIRLIPDESGDLTLRKISEEFAVYVFDTVLQVYTSTLSIYSWTGETFEFTDEQIVSLPHKVYKQEITPYTLEYKDFVSGDKVLETFIKQAVITATNKDGVTATIIAKGSDDFYYGMHIIPIDFCELFLEGKQIGPPFACKHNFTTLEWKDITSDGQPEIIVIALAGTYTVNEEGEYLSEESCFNQHLYAYQWNGTKTKNIADIVGCVIQSDLYGVRLEDFDNDGKLEILSIADWTVASEDNTNNWFEPEYVSEVYEWDGSKFVFSSKVAK